MGRGKRKRSGVPSFANAATHVRALLDGDSENYFVIAEKGSDSYAYDHKYGVAYNALTYLLIESDERDADSESDDG